MSTFNRLITLFRGQVRTGTEAVLEANALALLDQQLFDTEQGLISARPDLAALMAERSLADKQLQRVRQDQTRYEEYALSALRQDQAELAEETAARVAELEQQSATLVEQISTLEQRETEFRELIREAGQTLKSLRQQQAVARVSERMQRSTQRLNGGNAGLQEKLEESRATLTGIQQRQERARAEWQARRELERDATPAALDRRLEDAGILHGRKQQQQAVLERLRRKLDQ